jgi:RHS repeat-associated protein
VTTVTYDVDAKGRRVARRVNGTVERQWMYDGQLRIVGEVVYQAQVSYRVYGYVPERHLPVLMLETKNGVQTQYRIYGDHLGSMRAVVRVSDGNAVQVMRHGPWGELELDSVASGFARVPFGFAGGIHDDATKLVRFGAREYDARTGRWLSKDEARFGGGENFYEYVAGDPVNRVDRNGRSWQDFLDWLGGGPGGGGKSGGGGASGDYGDGGEAGRQCIVRPKKQCPYTRSEFKGDPDRTICYYACADGTNCSKTLMGYATCPSWNECGDSPN